MRYHHLLLATLLTACASTPEGKLHQAATLSKIGVDGLGNTYLDVCETIVKPQCIADNDAAEALGTPWTKEQRIACLRPCDSATAEQIKTALDGMIAAQLVVFGILKAGIAEEDKLGAAQAELREAAEHLAKILEETGATKFVQDKLFGG